MILQGYTQWPALKRRIPKCQLTKSAGSSGMPDLSLWNGIRFIILYIPLRYNLSWDRAMSIKNFIFSKTFLKNLGLAAVIVVGLIMALLIWLNFYTRHGQSRPVPQFVGLTMDQTIRQAKKSKVRFQIIDSVYTSEVPRGCIAEQNPKAGFK